MTPPRGCDQQGRYPQAAEAATDIGSDDFADAATFVLWQVVIAIVLVGLIAAVVALQ
jgi:uncharacterized membrane protein